MEEETIPLKIKSPVIQALVRSKTLALTKEVKTLKTKITKLENERREWERDKARLKWDMEKVNKLMEFLKDNSIDWFDLSTYDL